MPIIYIGIGSNLGRRVDNCNKAISLLMEMGGEVLKQSRMIETAPWGIKEQPPFINMAIKVRMNVSPEALLNLLKDIEQRMGRSESARWGPRIIDLDILFYNNLVMKTPDLEIPHPHIDRREFVLRPLAEIEPDLMHPVLKMSVKELLNALAP